MNFITKIALSYQNQKHIIIKLKNLNPILLINIHLYLINTTSALILSLIIFIHTISIFICVIIILIIFKQHENQVE